MLHHPFTWLMLATFLAALVTLLTGVAGMANRQQSNKHNRATWLMAARVGLCILLLIEMLIYHFYLNR